MPGPVPLSSVCVLVPLEAPRLQLYQLGGGEAFVLQNEAAKVHNLLPTIESRTMSAACEACQEPSCKRETKMSLQFYLSLLGGVLISLLVASAFAANPEQYERNWPQ